MKEISTAEELFKTEYSIMDSEYPEMAAHVRRKVIEFAKFHVEAALQAASEKAQTNIKDDWDGIGFKNSIINAYPLTNIK
ncbi:MAG: hypothetical protein ACK52I_07690 [Pseudomonadota bacterium]|jgi:hypothetical protein